MFPFCLMEISPPSSFYTSSSIIVVIYLILLQGWRKSEGVGGTRQLWSILQLAEDQQSHLVTRFKIFQMYFINHLANPPPPPQQKPTKKTFQTFSQIITVSKQLGVFFESLSLLLTKLFMLDLRNFFCQNILIDILIYFQ